MTPRTHQLAVRTLKIQQNYLARLRSQEENEDDYDSDAADVDPPDSMVCTLKISPHPIRPITMLKFS